MRLSALQHSTYFVQLIPLSFYQNQWIASYTMSDVGIHLTGDMTKKKIKGVITHLNYVHRIGIIHCDPRLQNIIIVNGRYKWIDVREETATSFESDVKILWQSIFNREWDESDSQLETYC